jgi:glutamate racemase
MMASGMDDRPIGVFDSGVGGLTVVDEARKLLPNEHIIYLGDTARVPYGSKSRETVIEYGRDMTRFLIGCSVKAIIIACGTVSSNAYEILTEEFDIPLIDVIRPGVRACLDANPRGVGFIATEATVRSGLFIKLFSEGNLSTSVHTRACPLFVPLAEEGWLDNAFTQSITEIYVGDWKDKGIDTLVLGCTHYPLLKNAVKRALGTVRFINMAEYTILAAKAALAGHGLLNTSGAPASYTFYVSGYRDKFNRMAKRMLGMDCSAEKVEL